MGREKGLGTGKLHPVAWYHSYDGGRSFYTALGHVPAIFSDAAYLNHLYAGIFWAATGKKTDFKFQIQRIQEIIHKHFKIEKPFFNGFSIFIEQL
jgi:type 1 glutamine amidotransferase